MKMVPTNQQWGRNGPRIRKHEVLLRTLELKHPLSISFSTKHLHFVLALLIAVHSLQRFSRNNSILHSEGSLMEMVVQKDLTETEHKSERRGVAVGMAFNHISDVQRPEDVFDPVSAMRVWNKSIHRHPEINAIVFSNMFDSNVQELYTTKQVKFVYLDPLTHKALDEGGVRQRSIYDQRWYLLEWIMKQNYMKGFEYIIFADMSDGEFLRNPFEFMHGMDQIMGSPQLYISTEIPNEISWGWLNKWDCFHGERVFKEGEARYYNAGLTGGKLSRYKHFLADMMKAQRYFNVTVKNNLCDMAHVERIVVDLLNESVITGYPFHTRFRKFESDGHAFVRHK